MNSLLALDPGKRTGWAFFARHQLVDAHYREIKDHARSTSREQINKIPGAELVLIETPRWYPHERKIDVNDLLDLSRLVGRLQDNFEGRGCKVELVFPRTWKGTVDKPVMSQRIYDRLTAEEIARVPRRPRADRELRSAKAYDHNCLDAIGLGLWKLGRMHGAA